MGIELISKRELDLINRKNHKYYLAIAEKDYFLAIVSKIIFDSHLKDKLVFKGGTAIHHCYLPQYRFSEDLDFTSLDKNITLHEVKAVLESNDFIRIKKEYQSNATIKFERVQYTGPLGLPNYLKVEIDFLQNVVLPAKLVSYENIWNIKTSVMVMDVKEICAEKIRAANERARYRDFYDLYLLLEKYKFDKNGILDLMKKKETRKTLSRSSVMANWAVALKEKNEDEQSIYYSNEVPNDLIEKMINSLSI
jgi:predicted nucleotidyltransferase component of viral defense system